MSGFGDIDPFADATGETTSGDLLRLSGMLQQIASLDTEIADLEAKLAEKKTRRWRLANLDLRDMLINAHVQEHVSHGKRVRLATDIEAKLPKEAAKRERVLQWLRETHNDGIIKTLINIEFGRGHRETAERLLLEIQRLTNHPVRLTEDVHHATYAAFARELVRDGKPFPDDVGIKTIDAVHIEDVGHGTQRKGRRSNDGGNGDGTGW